MLEILDVNDFDIPALSRLFMTVRKEEFPWVEDARLEDYAECTAGEDVVVAWHDGVPAGFISVWASDCFVHNLFVAKEHRGCGAGSALLDEAFRRYGKLSLKCVEKNISAMRFYLSYGFFSRGAGISEDGPYRLLECLDCSIRLHSLVGRSGENIERIAAVWKRSVSATHKFVSREHFGMIEQQIPSILSAVPQLIVACKDQRIVGFMGLDGKSLEMLFIDPSFIGKGLGRRLVEYAFTFSVDRVDVNEQNEAAYGFYRKMGFVPASRSGLDGCGLPYPTIHMVRKQVSRFPACTD